MNDLPVGELRLDEKEFKVNLGSGKRIFVGSGTDMWRGKIEWIARVLKYCNQYFTNTSLTRKNQESTGNAGITMPRPSNTVFAAGDHTLEELIEISEKPTLLITSTWYTRYQSFAPPGVLSSLPKDGMFLVKNKGKILEPVRELRINSNHYHMLENTIALGKEIKQVSTWLSTSGNPVFAPFMLIEDIKMTTGTK